MREIVIMNEESIRAWKTLFHRPAERIPGLLKFSKSALFHDVYITLCKVCRRLI